MRRHIVSIGQTSFSIWAEKYFVSLCGRPFQFFVGDALIAEVPPGASVRQIQAWEKA